MPLPWCRAFPGLEGAGEGIHLLEPEQERDLADRQISVC